RLRGGLPAEVCSRTQVIYPQGRWSELVQPKLRLIAGMVIFAVSIQPGFAQEARGGSGMQQTSGPPPLTGAEQSQFELFALKLNLDEKKQLPQVQSILGSAAAEASPTEREMTRLRTRMLEVSEKPDELGALTKSYEAQAAKMVNVEIKAFGEIR